LASATLGVCRLPTTKRLCFLSPSATKIVDISLAGVRRLAQACGIRSATRNRLLRASQRMPS